MLVQKKNTANNGEQERGKERKDDHVKELRTKGFINKVKDGKVRKEH